MTCTARFAHGAALLVTSGAVAAGGAQTEQFNLPTAPLNIFGVQFTADFLGPPAGTIVEARAELNFSTTSLDAADIILTFQAPSEGVPIWQFSGADLGWSGTGKFQASLTTDQLNGVIDLGEPKPDFSLFFLAIQAENFQPLGGQFTDSFFQVDIVPPAIPGDVNGDGAVGTSDLLQLLAAWGGCAIPCPPTCAEDVDGDCNVGTADLLILLANWG